LAKARALLNSFPGFGEKHLPAFWEKIADGRIAIANRGPRDVAGWSMVGGRCLWLRVDGQWSMVVATPPAFRESVKVGEQVLFAQARGLVGDRDPRAQEFTLQLRAIDADKTGAGLGVAVLTALCGSLLGRNSKGGTIVVGSATLGGSIELVPNAVHIAELAIEKQAQKLLMPVSARRPLVDLPDELWTKVSIEFYKDPADAVFKALVE
jgi:predicted ATP-dependent Lon-type protease